MYCIPSFNLLVITEYGIIGTCIMHEVITLIIMIKYTILTTIPYLYRNTYFASNLQTYHLSCNFTQFLCYTSCVTLTHNFFLSLSKVLVINNRIHHMALKRWFNDTCIHTMPIQCNTICPHPVPYILPNSDTHPPSTIRDISFLLYMHLPVFFPLKILPKCKKKLHINQKMNPFTCRYNG